MKKNKNEEPEIYWFKLADALKVAGLLVKNGYDVKISKEESGLPDAKYGIQATEHCNQGQSYYLMFVDDAHIDYVEDYLNGDFDEDEGDAS